MHTPEVLETKELTAEWVGYRIRCCNDPMSDSWHTMHVTIPDHKAVLDEQKIVVAARHEAILAWRMSQTNAVKTLAIDAHTAEVIETKELSNEVVSYVLRCCGDSTTDFELRVIIFTLGAKDAPKSWQQELADTLTDVATKHKAKLAWRQSVADSKAAAPLASK